MAAHSKSVRAAPQAQSENVKSIDKFLLYRPSPTPSDPHSSSVGADTLVCRVIASQKTATTTSLGRDACTARDHAAYGASIWVLNR